MKQLFLPVLMLALVIGCGAKVLDAGSNDSDGFDDGPVEGKRRSYPAPSHSFRCVPGNPDCWGRECTGTPPAWLAGTWRGEFDDYAFPSGSRTVVIHVDGRGMFPTSPGVCGRVIFGSGAAPPLPNDPEAAPPGGNIEAYGFWSRIPTEGFVYEFYPSELAEAGPMAGQSVQFALFRTQAYKAWCELQLSYPQRATYGESYGCLPPHVGVSGGAAQGTCTISLSLDPADTHPISCAQVALCGVGSPCKCSGRGCTIEEDPTHADLLFDLTFDGESAAGGATVDGIRPLRLQRVSVVPPPPQ
jgi:hypothetical protein